MIRLFTTENQHIAQLQYEPEDLRDMIPQACWIDVLAPTDDERAILSEMLLTDVPSAAEFEEIEATARCFVDDIGIHVNTLFLVGFEGAYRTQSVACILQPHRLITVREEKIVDFRLFRMRARRGHIECSSPLGLLISILEQKVENMADTIEDLHQTLDRIAKPIFEEQIGSPGVMVSQLAAAEDLNGKMRLCLMDTHRDISFLLRHIKESRDLQQTCDDIMKDIDALMSHNTFLFEKINFLMDFIRGFVSIQQNQVIKILSIAATVFLPPTLIASIYGMNFHHMPELDWSLGYPLALGGILLSGMVPYLIFKWKKWL